MKDVLVLEGDWTTKADLIPANFSGIESAFEQELVTDENDQHYGKYQVNVKVTNEDKSKENNITFYINEPLRGVGDVKDKVYVKDDKIVVERNCGSYTFDGSEEFGGFTISNGGVPYAYTFELVDKKAGQDNYMFCDRLNCFRSYAFNTPMAINGDVNTVIYIMLNKSIGTLQKFKQWLQQNPTTVVYQLAEPIYEEVEYNDVKLFIESFKNSTLFYDSNVPVTSTVHYSYSVPIVDTVAQTADISDEQDQLIIDLATQCAVMEIMLM